MPIDWFTVGAQALNFIVLVWLMKRFLYGPILDVVERRDARVAAELADAEHKQLEARQARDDFQQKNDDWDYERAAMLDQAKDQAEVEGQRLLTAARATAEAASTRFRRTLDESASSLYRAIEARTQREVFAIAKRTLADLASASLEERLTEVFVRRLRALDDAAKSELAAALQTAADRTIVRSAFELPVAQRAAIQNALNETTRRVAPIRFETAPDLVSGIELSTSGCKVAWSIAEYLRTMAEAVRTLVERSSAPDTEVAQRAQEAVATHGA